MSRPDRRCFVLCGLLLTPVVACVDYGLAKPGPIEGADDTGPPGGGDDTGDWGPCGPPDLTDEIAVNEACEVTAEIGVFDPVIEWKIERWDDQPESREIIAAPVVGHLVDDNGDGVYGPGDVPSVVVVTHEPGAHKHGMIRRLDGRTGAMTTLVRGSYPDGKQIFPYRYATPAIGDIDGDGRPDIVTVAEIFVPPEDGGTGVPDDGGGGGGEPQDDNPIGPAPPAEDPGAEDDAAFPVDMNCGVAAWDVDGTLLWATDPGLLDCSGHGTALADLDGDGRVEVVVGRTVLEGADGSMRFVGEGDEGRHPSYAELGTHSAVADLDGDGQQELIAGRTRYAPDGTVLCAGAGPTDGFVGIADLDLDGQGEWVVVGDGRVDVYDTGCSTRASWTLTGGGNGGPPTIGDLDGDGEPEIALASALYYAAYEADGELMWRTTVRDESSHATGSVIFDFEADGAPEVVYADEEALHVFDGATGEVLMRSEEHTSRTLHDFPPVADVDADGNAEIVVPQGGGHYGEENFGLYVLGSESGSWQAGQQVWNQHAFSITNVGADMSVPAVPEPNWPTHNNFRSGDPTPSSGGKWPDAVPAARVCTEECDRGTVVIDVSLANQGAATLRRGVPLTLWLEKPDGTTVLVEEHFFSGMVEAGAIAPAVRVRLSTADAEGGTLYLSVDEDASGVGYASECVETNNSVVVDAACP
ncbi:MAG: VCBS repeat-containing protein [Alphaproteobacteria bacterium]|nr:VCBS repeat-containing protein [Alphaproteobacteria bacterium]